MPMLNYFTEKNLNVVGSVASIIGFIITCITLYLVRNIKKQFLLKIRIAELQTGLNESVNKISALLNKFDDNENEIKQEINRTYVLLRSVFSKSTNPLRKDIKVVMKMIKWVRLRWRINIKKIKPQEDDLRRIYTELQIAITELKNTMKDLQWR
jgi:hypothetical protein